MSIYLVLLVVALLGTVLLTVDMPGPSPRREFWGAVLTVTPLMLIVVLASLRIV